MKNDTKPQRQPHPVRRYLVTAFIILAVIGVFFFLNWMNKVKFYDDPATTGNTSGNLLNGGLFTQSGDTIYFANPYDENALYSMNMDLKKIKKLSRDNVSYLNAAGDYIFYTRRNDKKGDDGNAILSMSTTGLYRINTKGNGLSQLFRNPTQTVNLFGNNLFYQHYDDKKGLQLFRIGIDGKKDTMLLDEGAAPTAITNGMIYYTGMDSDHNIHSMDMNGSGTNVVLEGNYTGLSYSNGSLYFMDMNQNYALCQANPDGSDAVQLVQDRIATYNVSEDGNTIYYQLDNGTDNGLYSLDTNTGTQKLLRAGNYNYLHMISNYLFFEEFDGSAAYVMELSSGQIQDFKPETEE